MDPAKTISYRRWRNKLINKGFFTKELGGSKSFRVSTKLKRSSGEEAMERDARNLKLRMVAFKRRISERGMQKLVKRLERELHKSRTFRREKVENLKQLIKSGQYQIPGRKVVEKWFPEPPASKSRE